MLVVSANWAIADGTLLPPAPRRQCEWLAAVHRAAIRAGFRRDGRYAAVERIDVVLAGDTFDALTSTAWLTDVRPWHRGAKAADVAAAVLVAAAARGRRLLAGLGRWARTGLPVPAADRRGRPTVGERVWVPVRLVILPGDRDRWIAGAAARLARRGIAVAPTWSADGISIWHGAELDPLWSSGGDADAGRPSLGASLAVDLVARFAAAVRSRSGLWPACRPLVSWLAAAPPLDLPAVVAAWLDRVPGLDVRDQWLAAVAGWRRQARRAEPCCEAGFDSIDAVAAWMEGVRPWPAGAARAAELEGLLGAPPPGMPADATVVSGHGWGTAPAVIMGSGQRPWRTIAATPSAGGPVSSVVPVGRGCGPLHAVRLDDRRPVAWQPLLPEDEPFTRPDVGPRHPAAHRIVEAA